MSKAVGLWLRSGSTSTACIQMLQETQEVPYNPNRLSCLEILICGLDLPNRRCGGKSPFQTWVASLQFWFGNSDLPNDTA